MSSATWQACSNCVWTWTREFWQQVLPLITAGKVHPPAVKTQNLLANYIREHHCDTCATEATVHVLFIECSASTASRILAVLDEESLRL